MRSIYNSILYLLTPFVLLRLMWRSRRLPAYRQRLAERFACFNTTVPSGGIWVHAVSVGEVIAAAPLIKRIIQAYPLSVVIVTTMTPTGSEQVSRHFPDAGIFHVYAPYDLPVVVQRFLDKIQPRIAVMMETELWPNILYYCRQRGIPTLIANARLSPASTKGYARLQPFTRQMLQNVTMVIAQSTADAERYMQLGVDAKQIAISGSVKFDLQLPASLAESAEVLRQQWGVDRPVWIAASTHEGEEEAVLQAFAEIRQTSPQTLLLLAPRHPDRLARVMMLVQREKYNTVLRSSGQRCMPETAVFLIDTLGELILFYAASDVAFVGGSLSQTGGHNLLEPAALGIPIVIGPHMFNFAEITVLLQNAGALIQIQDKQQLATATLAYLQDSERRVQAGEQGRNVVAKNRGALDIHLSILQGLLSPRFS